MVDFQQFLSRLLTISDQSSLMKSPRSVSYYVAIIRLTLVRRFLLGLLGLAGAVGVALGVAPHSTLDENVEIRSVSAPVAISPREIVSADSSQGFVREERVLRGDTIFSLLARLQVSDTGAQRFFSRPTVIRALAPWTTGRAVVARVDREGRLLELTVRDDESVIVVSRENDSDFLLSVKPVETEIRIVLKSGAVASSLYSATDEAGIPDSISAAFAEVFSSEVDLHRDLRAGDHFSMVYEMTYSNGEALRPGKLLAAEFTNQGRTLQAIYFQDENGQTSYFAPNGKNLRQAFLKSPIEFSRITSGFSTSRLHPVLQVWRAHKGIDYGAPIGTRVRATSDGVVSFAGWQNGYGKTVVIRHSRGYTTLYGHLSGFPRELRSGNRVQQGEVIGFVGMTGLATGPHLHYEFHVNGGHVDPTRLAKRPGNELSVNSRHRFLEVASDRLSQLSALRDVSVASAQ